MSNYKQMYEDKCKQFEQLNAQFNQYQQHSNFIITDLQQQVKQLKKKNEAVSREHAELKERRKTSTISLQKQIQLAKKEREQFKNKFVEFEKKVIELQNINQSQQSDLRATRATLHEYEQRIEKTMEELALLQIQMQQSTENNQEQIARLRSQLKQTEDELYALHHAKNKNDNGNKQNENKNMNESFNSKQSQKQVRISQSKIRRKNTKFSQTLVEIRDYIKQITSRRQKLATKFQQLI